jgi:hypothetical protein
MVVSINLCRMRNCSVAGFNRAAHLVPNDRRRVVATGILAFWLVHEHVGKFANFKDDLAGSGGHYLITCAYAPTAGNCQLSLPRNTLNR